MKNTEFFQSVSKWALGRSLLGGMPCDKWVGAFQHRGAPSFVTCATGPRPPYRNLTNSSDSTPPGFMTESLSVLQRDQPKLGRY